MSKLLFLYRERQEEDETYPFPFRKSFLLRQGCQLKKLNLKTKRGRVKNSSRNRGISLKKLVIEAPLFKKRKLKDRPKLAMTLPPPGNPILGAPFCDGGKGEGGRGTHSKSPSVLFIAGRSNLQFSSSFSFQKKKVGPKGNPEDPLTQKGKKEVGRKKRKQLLRLLLLLLLFQIHLPLLIMDDLVGLFFGEESAISPPPPSPLSWPLLPEMQAEFLPLPSLVVGGKKKTRTDTPFRGLRGDNYER